MCWFRQFFSEVGAISVITQKTQKCPYMYVKARRIRVRFLSYCLYWNGINQRHDDVIKWKHFPRYWPFVWGIHRSPVNSPHKGQWRGALIFYLICAWINGGVNNREAGDLRRHRAHNDVIVMREDVTYLNNIFPHWLRLPPRDLRQQTETNLISIA